MVPGLGVRCVSDEPWVTGAETCELAMALDAIGQPEKAMELFDQIQFLRDPEGGYWTGWQFVTQKHFPYEMSSWTAAAIVLAADTLAIGAGGASTGAAGLFRELAAPSSVWQAADPAACGCTEGSPGQE
jgi:hypothetical protein